MTAGQVLATVGTTALQSDVDAAQANVASAQARLSSDEARQWFHHGDRFRRGVGHLGRVLAHHGPDQLWPTPR